MISRSPMESPDTPANRPMSSESPSIFELIPGKLVADRYAITRHRRHNELAYFFETEDRESGDRRELIYFPATLFEEAGQIDEFIAGCEPWKAIASSHVVRTREVIRCSDDSVILVTDYAEGPSLRERLRAHGRMEASSAIRLGLELLEGLVAIHEAGGVHGDIKPQTIYLGSEQDDEAHACLVDGGITPGLWHAKQLGDSTSLIGTPVYASVEQFGGEAPDVQSDVYNVATVLFELVCGAMPWAGTNFLEIFQAKLDKGRPSMKARAPEVEVDPELEAVIVRGLMADRRDRYATSAEFLDALRSVGKA